MGQEQASITYDVGRLLSVVEGLSPQKIRWVILYAENLKNGPTSDTGKSYIAMLLEEGADSGEILAAAQAIHDVDARLAREVDSPARLDALHRRTEEHFYHWCREKGIDYNTLSEEEFSRLVEQAIQRVRAG